MASAAIDRRSATPYYRQLVDVLERRIAAGEVALGQRLASEHELCAEFGLSRATVRQALRLLVSRGMATRITGRGVFASEPSDERGWVIQGPEGFMENAISHQNRAITTHVLRHGPALLSAQVCRALRVPEDTAGYELVRQRLLDGVPAVFSINYSPPPLVPILAGSREVLDGTASLSELLAGAGYVLGGAHRVVRAVTPDQQTATALQVEPATPILHIRSTSWTPGGHCYDVYDTWVRSDVVPLEVNVNTAAVTGS